MKIVVSDKHGADELLEAAQATIRSSPLPVCVCVCVDEDGVYESV